MRFPRRNSGHFKRNLSLFKRIVGPGAVKGWRQYESSAEFERSEFKLSFSPGPAGRPGGLGEGPHGASSCEACIFAEPEVMEIASDNYNNYTLCRSQGANATRRAPTMTTSGRGLLGPRLGT